MIASPLLIEPALLGLAAAGGGLALVGKRARAVRLLAQVHRTTRVDAVKRLAELYVMRHPAAAFHRDAGEEDISRLFGGRISVLKEPGANGERGVLFVMFTEILAAIFSQMDVRRLTSDYTIVSEPSWSGYCDDAILRWTQIDDPVFVLAAQKDDFGFLERLNSNLIPVPLGPCDWVDAGVAEPFLENRKEFDIVMNSHWGESKRHHVLFRMLSQAKRRYKVLLIGARWAGRTSDDIRSLAAYYGVEDQLTIIEHIAYSDVMDLTCRARVSILLSLKEGSNRAIAESIFCNVPVIVLSTHVGGIVKNVQPETGLLIRESQLEEAVETLLEANLNPRRWGLENASHARSTEKLNAILRANALERGEPWTRDIAPRSNSPESKYTNADDAARLAAWNASLKNYLARTRPD
jgi:glycosyltransferase involved in cell wall biosynthesis